MIFETLYASALRNELILVDGGFCHYHLRRDGQLTIREIIVLPEYQRRGIGTMILKALCQIPGATSIFAKCPSDLPANGWYERMGFSMVSIETTRTGREVNCWRLQL